MRPIDERSVADLTDTAPGSLADAELQKAANTPLRQLTLPQLRALIRARLGLQYVVPRALAHLREHSLAQTRFMPGDLLTAVLRVPDDWWRAHPALIPDACTAIEHALPRLEKRHALPELEATLQSRLLELQALARAV